MNRYIALRGESRVPDLICIPGWIGQGDHPAAAAQAPGSRKGRADPRHLLLAVVVDVAAGEERDAYAAMKRELAQRTDAEPM